MVAWATVIAATGATVLSGVAAYSAFWWYEGEKCEKPKYDVIKVLRSEARLFRGQVSVVEVRKYSSYIIAEATIENATMKEARSKGFMTVAKYIFGANKSVTSEQKENISMTAPVRMSVADSSDTIAMTSPVRMEEVSGGNTTDALLASTYKVSFVMPSKYTMETLPVPDNENLSISEVDAHTVIAIMFNGPAPSKKVMEEKKDELVIYMEAEGLVPDGDAMLYQYHPPFAPSFLRLNEVVINIKQQE